MPTYPDVTVNLNGQTDNDALISEVTDALREAYGWEPAARFNVLAYDCTSEDALLDYVRETVTVR